MISAPIVRFLVRKTLLTRRFLCLCWFGGPIIRFKDSGNRIIFLKLENRSISRYFLDFLFFYKSLSLLENRFTSRTLLDVNLLPLPFSRIGITSQMDRRSFIPGTESTRSFSQTTTTSFHLKKLSSFAARAYRKSFHLAL